MIQLSGSDKSVILVSSGSRVGSVLIGLLMKGVRLFNADLEIAKKGTLESLVSLDEIFVNNLYEVA